MSDPKALVLSSLTGEQLEVHTTSSLLPGKTRTICPSGSKRLGTRQNVSGPTIGYSRSVVLTYRFIADIGKFMNGINMGTYFYPPKGWDRTDVLVSPHPAGWPESSDL